MIQLHLLHSFVKTVQFKLFLRYCGFVKVQLVLLNTANKMGKVHKVRLKLISYLTLSHTFYTQRAEPILNKISNIINKIHTGLISVIQGFQNVLHEILATRAWKGRANQRSRFWPIRQNRAVSAMVASTAFPRPSCQDFMQYIFGILEACGLTLCKFCRCYLKSYLRLPQPSVAKQC